MSLAVKLNDKYTYGDYFAWNDDERWELIHGKAYCMSPAPGREHQIIAGVLFNKIFNFLKEKECEVYISPFDVRLPEANEKDEDIETVVQPDISVICEESKLDERGCRGAPDMVIEVISSGSLSKDLKEKYYLYEKHGINEYWVVFPHDKFIEVYKLGSDGRYGPAEKYFLEDKIKCTLLKGLTLELKDVFGREKKKKGIKPPPKKIEIIKN